MAAIVAIVTAIVIIERPFRGGQASDGTVVVVDAPERPATKEVVPTIVPTAEVEGVISTPTPTAKPKVVGGPLAPELVGINAWINSQPLKIGDLAGRVVLVDFWTYSCVNCIRTLPYLKVWHSKYADDGLVILGVHTPEFEFEENLDNVRQAVKDNGISWAVGLDNDYATWDAYKNRYWPAKYLIDKDGIIRYTRFGEGAYAQTESKIRQLLEDSGADLAELDSEMPDDQPLDVEFLKDRSALPTRELYGGWERECQDILYRYIGYVGDQAHCRARDMVMNHVDPGNHRKHVIYLQGPWYTGPENLKHGREASDFEDYIALRFSAKSVNAVIKPEGDEPGLLKVLVTLDGEDLTDSTKGEDVVIEEDGRGFVYVDEPRMYSIVQAPSYGTYELKLSSNSPDFALFAFTFGVYESGV